MKTKNTNKNEMKKKAILFAGLTTVALLAFISTTVQAHDHKKDPAKKNSKKTEYVTQSKESQAAMTPANAVEMLKEGNHRFVNDKMINRDLIDQVKATSTGQYPFAAVVSCIDSRIPTEIVFDQGVGDIFNARIAGNFVNTDILGSLEFAAKVAGSKAIVVMGHTECGAVKGACDNVKLGNLTPMLENIMPAIKAVDHIKTDRNSKNAEFVQEVADMNVELTIEKIKKDRKVLNEMYEKGEIAIIGAMYDVHTGEVTFTN